MMLTGAQNKLIGMDLGADSIKILEINSTSNPRCVEKFAIGSLPPGTIVKNEIKEPDVVTQVLKATLYQADIKTKNIAIAIPRSSTIIKNINIDNRLSADEIETRAWIEANHHFPDLVGDSYLDFAIVGPSSQDENQLELMLVACRKDIIKPYIEIAKNTDLNLKIVDVNSFALERALSLISASEPNHETIGLLNFDIDLSTLIVIQNEKLIYAHDEPFDGARLLKQLNETQGDELKLQNVVKENLTAYLRHIMHFFYSSRPNVSIKKIYFSGDCARDPALMGFIQQEIGIEMEIANPFLTLELNSGIDAAEIQTYSPALVLCAGLALSSTEGT